MAKITGKYEVLYIIDPTLGEEGIAALVEKFKAMGIVARDIMAENSTSIQLMLLELDIRTSYRVHKK